jgi:hypothetical protein
MQDGSWRRIVWAFLGVAALYAAILGPVSAATVFHLRFDDDSSSDVIDLISDLPVGVLQEGTVRCDDTPGPTSVHATNALALDSQRGNGAKITGAILPFIFHDNTGDATLEFYAKVPAGQPHSSLFWTENGPPGAFGNFNIFWEAAFAGVSETVAGDVGGPNPIAGTPVGAADWDTLPDSALFPTEEWFHVAIVRTDLDGAGGIKCSGSGF